MGGRAQGAVSFARVGPSLENGYDEGGARIYPFSAGLAISPPAYYGDYIGSGTGLAVAPPAASLVSTAGAGGPGAGVAAHVSEHPWSLQWSPLPYVVGGVVLSVVALYALHYREK